MRRSDERGALEVQELRPGHLLVRVEGHLTTAVGAAFPAFAREAAKRAERCTVYLDVRAMKGFDADVRQDWLEVVLSERHRIEHVAVATTGVFITLSARAAALALRAVGVSFEVLSRDAKLDRLVAAAA